MTAEVPIPNPIAKLMTVNVTGNVKLTAARGSVPNKLIKKVSTILNIINMIMPKIIGTVMVFNVGKMGSLSKSGRVLVFFVTRMK